MNGERERQLLVLLVTGIIVVIIVAVLLIINVWNKNDELVEQSKEYKVGTIYVDNDIDYEDYVINYFGKIEQLLMQEDIDSLYSYLGQDYIEYIGMTKEKFQEYLSNKKITKQILELKAYEMVSIEGFSNVYIMNIKLKEGIYDLNIVIREKSPNDFTIAFDDYIKNESSDYNTTMDGINLEIKSIIYFSDYIEYNLILKNVHDKKIELNKNNMAENIYLKLADNSLVTPYNTILGGRKIEIEPDRIKEYKIRYNIDNEKLNQISSIVIKDIYYEGKEITGDVEFVF